MKYFFKNILDFDDKIDMFRKEGLVPKTNKIDLIKFGNIVFSSKKFRNLPIITQEQVKTIIEATIKENSASKQKIIKFINLKEKEKINEFIIIISKLLKLDINDKKNMKQNKAKIIKTFELLKLNLKYYIYTFCLDRKDFDEKLIPDLIYSILELQNKQN